MVDTLDRSDQNIDADVAGLSKRGRVWLLIVAGVDVLLVITSLVALNAALRIWPWTRRPLRPTHPG